jgi:hypothetical protein
MYLCDPDAIHQQYLVFLAASPKSFAQEYVAKYSKSLVTSDMGVYI